MVIPATVPNKMLTNVVLHVLYVLGEIITVLQIKKKNIISYIIDNNLLLFCDLMSLYPIFLARDVVTHLNDVQTRSMNDFSWISQLRYYFIQELVQVKMITTTVAYAYEYLGNTGRLVITPLTDRCYR